MDTDSRYASRKFIICCASLFMAWVAFPCDLVTADQVLTFTVTIVGLYMAGNVGDSLVTKANT